MAPTPVKTSRSATTRTGCATPCTSRVRSAYQAFRQLRAEDRSGIRTQGSDLLWVPAMLQVSVYRYNPDKDAAPYMQDFQVDTNGKDVMVLDVLALIKEQDEGFSYRRSCREGVCGSDGMNINGKNGLACITPLSAAGLKGGKLVIRPLPGLPVIRDLVVDAASSQAIREGEAVPAERYAGPGHRASADPGRAREAGRSVRVHPVRLLLDLPARPSGGTPTSSSVRPHCCKPIVSWPTAVTPRPKSAWLRWTTRSVCSAAAES